MKRDHAPEKNKNSVNNRMSLAGWRDSERGAITVLVAALLVALVGLSALVIDIGHIAVVRSELQNAADVGVLTGVVELIMSGDDAARTTATAYATETDNFKVTNPPPQADAVTVTIIDPTTLQVRVSKQSGTSAGSVPTFFANVWGIKKANVSALAVATVEPNVIGTGPGNLIPFAVHKPWLLDAIEAAEDLNIYPFDWTAGNFGVLDLDHGANSNMDIVDWIEHGYDKPFVIPPGTGENPVPGILIEGDTGISGNSIVSALASRLGDPLVIPVFTEVTGKGGLTTFLVTDLVGAKVTSYQLSGSPDKRYIFIDIIKFPSNDFITGGGGITPDIPGLSKPVLIQ
jgi:Flp pilus assembly protein TadG